jgi:hypothetical protein
MIALLSERAAGAMGCLITWLVIVRLSKVVKIREMQLNLKDIESPDSKDQTMCEWLEERKRVRARGRKGTLHMQQLRATAWLLFASKLCLAN